MPRSKRFSFTRKKESKRGIISIVMAGVSLMGLILLIVLSMKNHGTSSAYIGSVGIFLMLMGVVGLILAIVSLREENSYPLFPRLGLILSAVTSALWGVLYAWGFTMQ